VLVPFVVNYIERKKMEEDLENTEGIGEAETTKHDRIEILKSYTSALATTTTVQMKTSSLDLANREQMAMHARVGIQDKHDIQVAESNYKSLNYKIVGQIKAHLNHMNKAYIDGVYGQLGGLYFNNPSLFLKSLDAMTNEILGESAITTANDYLAYSFLMFRTVSGKKAHNFQPQYVVTFDKDSKKNYNSNDILSTFKYAKDGGEVDAFVTTNTGKKKANDLALSILKADKEEISSILKNTFREFVHECNVLKQTSAENAGTVCRTFTDVTSPDYFLELTTCLEIFNLARDKNLCGEVEYENEDWDL
jgi:hypothetical protein